MKDQDRQAYYDHKVEKHTKTAVLLIKVSAVLLVLVAGYFLIRG